MARIVVMGGDGIGLEVVDAACTVPDRATGRLDLDLGVPTVLSGAPGGTRTHAHGSGGRCSIR